MTDHQHGAGCGCYRPDSNLPVYRPQPLPEQYNGPQVVHQHIHQAPPDRTLQRVSLGAGVGGGAVAASVYFGPLLLAAITSMAISLAIAALALLVTGWAVVSVVRSTEATAAAKAQQKRRKG